MSRIRILSEQLANQIAAGEVVERPASVIKELLENSLDAGASRIDVHIEGGGTRLLRVADDGEGMDTDDVLLCLERHATSKIREESQLGAIATLGFRGEAIPSIASVSWLTILSRPAEHALGSRAEVRYGTMQAVHEDGCPRGTVIEVRRLFGNMPARKKFLKSERTELHHIEEVVKNQALAYPYVGFRLFVNDRLTLEYRPDADLEQRVREVFRYEGTLLPLQGEGSAGGQALSLEGYLLLPESSPRTKARLRFLVNNRPVQDAMIRHAINEGMQGFLMKGYQPAGTLVLSLPPEQIDVNVHPAKREIRFRHGEHVHRFISERVRSAIDQYQAQSRERLFTPKKADQCLSRPVDTNVAGKKAPFLAPSETPRTAEADLLLQSQRLPLPQQAARPVPCATAEPTPAFAPSADPPISMPARQKTAGEGAEDFSGLHLIGQLFALYLLCEREGQFIVIDQHAAHERLLYGQLRQGYMQAHMPRQNLLFPVTVELTPVQAETLEKRAAEVETLGLQVQSFGHDTYVIKAVPALVSQINPGALLNEMLDALRSPVQKEGPRPVPQVVDELLASMACKAAIKAGNRLQPQEMLKLLEQMQASSVFTHCPHGRPVIKTFTDQEVEKWFHRHGG